jgi:hypothetical protein
MRVRLGTALTSGAAWVVGAASSVAVGLAALSLIGGGLGTHGVEPLTSERAAAVTEGSEPPSVAPTSPPAVDQSSSAPPASESTQASKSSDRVLRSAGGFVVARCVDDRAYLVSWTPEQGYEAHDVRRGPAGSASVEFEGRRQQVRLVVTCDGGVPQAHTGQETEDDSHT